MRKTLALLAGNAMLATLAMPALAQQTLTFSNSNPTVTVSLLSGSTLGINTNGNVTAQCQLDANNKCVGMPTGGTGGNPPTVTIAPSGFSTTPDSQNRYAPNTTFTITPSVTNAELCTRITTVGTPTGTGWTGNVAAPFTGVQVSLPTASSTYGFSLKCYGDGGAATATTITVATNAEGGGPGPITDQCTETIAPPAGYTEQATPNRFEDLRTVNGAALNPFPNTGGGLGRVSISRAKYVSLRFTVPADVGQYNGLLKRISWLEGQSGGEANAQKTYVSLTQCKTDFSVPTSNSATAARPTFALGCRNLRPGNNTIGINYGISAAGALSTNSMCNLKVGGTYYLNIILADPYDGGGITPGEHSCLNPDLTQCGFQMQAN